ncbi:N-acetylmuramic acid 6-phosphate etherase [Serinibacter salmoneus]|uniref:N-acetylmuramic acid 6-phosphate etherase n=1 Tax=Serinibacter salmoneus TaxID=556530 RepID=A0A2A9D2I2_9MICO|nr:N-acetylmuramic acid 6-phosphate etherase [Serinibacter salmoneus]PFG20059.1 N-acetylmuramic acid 6-phosphate etherase [Serinibacter salmoneus]
MNVQAGIEATDEAQRCELAALRSPTEERNPRTMAIDLMSASEIVETIATEDHRVAVAVHAAAGRIAALVDAAVQAITGGGKVHYLGAGTSGRIGVLDAVELLPTYGVGTEWFRAHLAGGAAAMLEAVEGAEDDPALGAADLAGLQRQDLVVGLAASGRTPYVRGALEFARRIGATTALVTANPEAELLALADIGVVLDTGPEVITGSTRMKAASAQKMALNMFSTAAMVRLGKTYSNLMVDVRPTNEKLRARALRLLAQACGASPRECAPALQEAQGDLPLALLRTLRDHAGIEPQDLAADRELLRAHGGVVRRALRATGAELRR